MEDHDGTMSSDHDPAECDNCLRGMDLVIKSLDAFVAKYAHTAPLPIELVMNGCLVQWQPNDLR